MAYPHYKEAKVRSIKLFCCRLLAEDLRSPLEFEPYCTKNYWRFSLGNIFICFNSLVGYNITELAVWQWRCLRIWPRGYLQPWFVICKRTIIQLLGSNFWSQNSSPGTPRANILNKLLLQECFISRRSSGNANIQETCQRVLDCLCSESPNDPWMVNINNAFTFLHTFLMQKVTIITLSHYWWIQ